MVRKKRAAPDGGADLQSEALLALCGPEVLALKALSWMLDEKAACTQAELNDRSSQRSGSDNTDYRNQMGVNEPVPVVPGGNNWDPVRFTGKRSQRGHLHTLLIFKEFPPIIASIHARREVG